MEKVKGGGVVMTEDDALEKMEGGGVTSAKKDVLQKQRRFWEITLLLSITIMATSLLIFYLTGKSENMEQSTARGIKILGKLLILQYAAYGAVHMYCQGSLQSLSSSSPADRAGFEFLSVVFICIVTLWLGKILEVFIYTVSLVVGGFALGELSSPVDEEHDNAITDINHLYFIVGLVTFTGCVCLVPKLFFFLGWFSILLWTSLFIVRFNFPDKSIVEAFSMVLDVLDLPDFPELPKLE